MTEAVWSALEQLVCGEYVKQQIICHETGPIVVSGRNISGKSRIEERFANSEVMLQIHSRFLMLSIRKNKQKYLLAVPWHFDNYYGSQEQQCAMLSQRIDYQIQRELRIECIKNDADTTY